jgi:hypothetical protein
VEEMMTEAVFFLFDERKQCGRNFLYLWRMLKLCGMPPEAKQILETFV